MASEVFQVPSPLVTLQFRAGEAEVDVSEVLADLRRLFNETVEAAKTAGKDATEGEYLARIVAHFQEKYHVGITTSEAEALREYVPALLAKKKLERRNDIDAMLKSLISTDSTPSPESPD